MKGVLNCITSIQIQPGNNSNLNVSLGFDKKGAIIVSFQDPAKLEQDTSAINDDAYPNSGLMVFGKYAMWLSMFTRHIKKPYNLE